MSSVKQQLYEYCLAYILQRIDHAQVAIRAAQSSANEETKSSAGDKYETGRAMAQLEIEKNSAQLNEALRIRQSLARIASLKNTESVQHGSLVVTSNGNYYISIPGGQFIVDEEIYYAISPDSPIGSLLMGLTAGASFMFRGKRMEVRSVM